MKARTFKRGQISPCKHTALTQPSRPETLETAPGIPKRYQATAPRGRGGRAPSRSRTPPRIRCLIRKAKQSVRLRARLRGRGHVTWVHRDNVTKAGGLTVGAAADDKDALLVEHHWYHAQPISVPHIA
eukprot:1092946-Rhodomonas_salina.2